MAELGEQLSEREQEVLEQLVQGATNKVIAANLFISPNTVKVHLRNINTKLGASSRTEASRIALERGLVTIPGMEIVAEAEPDVQAKEDVEEAGEATTALESPNGQINQISDDPIQQPAASDRPTWLYALGGVGVLAVIGFAVWYFVSQDAPVVVSAPYEPSQVGDSRWFESRALPEALAGASSASIGSNIFVIGGQQSDGTANADMHVYNANDHEWWVADPMPRPSYDSSAVRIPAAPAFVVVGGKTAENQPTAAVSGYDLDQRAWAELQSLPKPLSNGLLLSDGALIYHLGGDDGSGPVSDTYIYDPVGDSWQELTAMPESRAGATGGIVRGTVYVIGGEDATGNPTSDCFKLSIVDQVWSSCASMGNSRINASGSVILNQIYVIGGETSADFGELYNPESDKWEQISQPMVEGLDSPDWTNSAASVVDANKLFVLGGEFNGTLSTDTFFYSPLVYQSFIPSATNE